MSDKPSQSGFRVLLAASLVSAVLGSIHAFSVFIEPLEEMFAASRSSVSLTYSFALAALTIAVLIGPRVFSRWPAALFLFVVCVLAALGALFASIAGSLPGVWVGYSLIFGAANGLGYGYGLQISAQANPGGEGLAMGIVTAAYALGAALSPLVFGFALETQGFGAAMIVLAIALLVVGILSAALLRKDDIRFSAEPSDGSAGVAPVFDQVFLWLGYFGGVMAGLMVIGHAAGIAAAVKPGMAAWSAPAVISVCNLCGSLVGGRLADKWPPGLLLASFALATSVTLVGITATETTGGLLIGLGSVGFFYGGTIASYPAAIAKRFGMQHSAKVYGRVFTAWGCAGLSGPWLAGYLFDWQGEYQPALYVAASIALMSVVAVTILFHRVCRKI